MYPEWTLFKIIRNRTGVRACGSHHRRSRPCCASPLLGAARRGRRWSAAQNRAHGQQHDQDGGGRHQRDGRVHGGQQHEGELVQRPGAVRTETRIVVGTTDAVHKVRANDEPAEHEGVHDVARVLLALVLQPLLLDGVSHERGEQQQRLDQPNEAADDHPAGYEFALWAVVHVDGAQQDH